MDINDAATKFEDWFMIIVYVLLGIIVLLVLNALANLISCCKCMYNCICCPARCFRRKYQQMEP